jgi:hypothetical protein
MGAEGHRNFQMLLPKSAIKKPVRFMNWPLQHLLNDHRASETVPAVFQHTYEFSM